LSYPKKNPFNKNGRLHESLISDQNLEELIYLKAKDYKFQDPGQIKNLMQQEEIKRIVKNFNIIINKDEVKHQLSLLIEKNKELKI
jgi:predicted nucleotidyltransferase